MDDTAADEIIRLASPTMHFRRTATADTELGGKTIRKGDKVVLWFVSGNRDETVFDAPHMPRLDRNPDPNVAFGQGGPHFCLGMWLARLEVKVVLQALAGRLSSIEALSRRDGHGPTSFAALSRFRCGCRCDDKGGRREQARVALGFCSVTCWIFRAENMCRPTLPQREA